MKDLIVSLIKILVSYISGVVKIITTPEMDIGQKGVALIIFTVVFVVRVIVFSIVAIIIVWLLLQLLVAII